MKPNTRNSLILALLAVLMVATRVNHWTPIPDASWAVFFIGGFYLRTWTRWAFPLLMALAVAIDYAVITRQGINFWEHYCVSAAYWFLVPAYFAMWAGGLWVSRNYSRNWRTLGLTAVALIGSVALCQLLSQGSFYWISDSVQNKSFAGWAANYFEWLLPYLRTTATYVGIATVVQAIAASASKADKPLPAPNDHSKR
ncbi:MULTISPECIES: hypothetical protein [Lysobacter]|uniref:hypothetical protein n=1 Tax=Lysobacter TaxID=68 RepID=UPI001F44B6ED|nr:MULTISPECIES: hypothetical protein [Lysobacter]UJB20366.1 hypothetical protein L1A79_04600 [Lysobacter capsici]UJQ30520.1 hypothetical protein L2D09_10260 [Lysobacter gummosus]